MTKKPHYHFSYDGLTILEPTLEIDLSLSFSMQRLPKSNHQSSTHKVIQNSLGNIIEQSIEMGGLLNGEMKQYYDDGSIKSHLHYLKNELMGPQRFYSTNGDLLSESWYVNGKKQGAHKKFYLDGSLYSIERYKDDDFHLTQEYYYQKGQIKTLMHFNMGVIDQNTKLYHSNGNLKREIPFINGKREGWDRQWDLNGMLLEEGYYKENERSKTYRRFYPNGKLSLIIEYIIPPNLYEYRLYSKNGILLQQVSVSKNQSVHYEEFNEQGEKVKQATGKFNGKNVIYDSDSIPSI